MTKFWMFRAALEGSTLPSPVGVSPASSSGPAPSPECLTADGVCLLEIVRREAAASRQPQTPHSDRKLRDLILKIKAQLKPGKHCAAENKKNVNS